MSDNSVSLESYHWIAGHVDNYLSIFYIFTILLLTHHFNSLFLNRVYSICRSNALKPLGDFKMALGAYQASSNPTAGAAGSLLPSPSHSGPGCSKTL